VSPDPAPPVSIPPIPSNIPDLRIERPSIARQIGCIGRGRPAPAIAYVLIETPLVPSQVGAPAFDPGIARQAAAGMAKIPTVRASQASLSKTQVAHYEI
jgi:hypothetical protein